jgi:hypothetical protein
MHHIVLDRENGIYKVSIGISFKRLRLPTEINKKGGVLTMPLKFFALEYHFQECR